MEIASLYHANRLVGKGFHLEISFSLQCILPLVSWQRWRKLQSLQCYPLLITMQFSPISFESQLWITVVKKHVLIYFFQVIVLDEAAIAAASIIPDQDLFTGSTSKLQFTVTYSILSVGLFKLSLIKRQYGQSLKIKCKSIVLFRV